MCVKKSEGLPAGNSMMATPDKKHTVCVIERISVQEERGDENV